MIKCVCLVEEKNHQLLLVQVRHRDKYYFPGGKIDEGEEPCGSFTERIEGRIALRIS